MKNTAFEAFVPDDNLPDVTAGDVAAGSINAQHLATSRLYMAPCIVINFPVTADASAGLAILNANCPFPIEILDVTIQARATSTGGTIKLTDGTSDITNTIACATDKATVRAGTIDAAKSSLAAGATLKAVASGAAVRGLVTIFAVKK